MRKHPNITLTEKLTGLAVAMLLVGGLSSYAGDILKTKESRQDFEFIAQVDSVDPLVHVEVKEGRDFVFQTRQYMDERSAEALEMAYEFSMLELDEVMKLQESRLESLEENLTEIEGIESIPTQLREEMRVEIVMEMRRAEQEVRRVMSEFQRLKAEKIAATVKAVEPVEVHKVPRVALPPLPPVTSDVQACDEKSRKEKEKGEKSGREGFMEALSFV